MKWGKYWVNLKPYIGQHLALRSSESNHARSVFHSSNPWQTPRQEPNKKIDFRKIFYHIFPKKTFVRDKITFFYDSMQVFLRKIL